MNAISRHNSPMLFGHGPQLGLGPAPEYTFAVVSKLHLQPRLHSFNDH